MEPCEFKVNDVVEAYKSFIGYITYIDHKNDTAEVEWEEDGEWNSANIPLKNLVKISYELDEIIYG